MQAGGGGRGGAGRGGGVGGTEMTLYNQTELVRDFGLEMVECLKNTIGEGLLPFSLDRQLYIPTSVLSNCPAAECKLAHDGYLELSLTRANPNHTGPPVAELKVFLEENLELLQLMYDVVRQFAPIPNPGKPHIEIHETQDRLLIVFTWPGRTLSLERVRLHIYGLDTEVPGAGHQDLSKKVLRIVSSFPVANNAQEAREALDLGYATGRGLVLVGSFYHKPSRRSMEFEIKVHYRSPQSNNACAVVLLPLLGVEGTIVSSNKEGFVYGVTHKGSNADPDSTVNTVLLSNLASPEGDEALNLAIADAKTRVGRIFWTADPPIQRIVSRLSSDLRRLGQHERLLVLQKADRLLAIRRAPREHAAQIAELQEFGMQAMEDVPPGQQPTEDEVVDALASASGTLSIDDHEPALQASSASPTAAGVLGAMIFAPLATAVVAAVAMGAEGAGLTFSESGFEIVESKKGKRERRIKSQGSQDSGEVSPSKESKTAGTVGAGSVFIDLT